MSFLQIVETTLVNKQEKTNTAYNTEKFSSLIAQENSIKLSGKVADIIPLQLAQNSNIAPLKIGDRIGKKDFPNLFITFAGFSPNPFRLGLSNCTDIYINGKKIHLRAELKNEQQLISFLNESGSTFTNTTVKNLSASNKQFVFWMGDNSDKKAKNSNPIIRLGDDDSSKSETLRQVKNGKSELRPFNSGDDIPTTVTYAALAHGGAFDSLTIVAGLQYKNTPFEILSGNFTTQREKLLQIGEQDGYVDKACNDLMGRGLVKRGGYIRFPVTEIKKQNIEGISKVCMNFGIKIMTKNCNFYPDGSYIGKLGTSKAQPKQLDRQIPLLDFLI